MQKTVSFQITSRLARGRRRAAEKGVKFAKRDRCQELSVCIYEKTYRCIGILHKADRWGEALAACAGLMEAKWGDKMLCPRVLWMLPIGKNQMGKNFATEKSNWLKFFFAFDFKWVQWTRRNFGSLDENKVIKFLGCVVLLQFGIGFFAFFKGLGLVSNLEAVQFRSKLELK